MSKKGQSYKALFTATIYSFIGSLFGLLALGLLAEPVSRVAIKFTKMDYFLSGSVRTCDGRFRQHEELREGAYQCYDRSRDQHDRTGSADGNKTPDLRNPEPYAAASAQYRHLSASSDSQKFSLLYTT